MSEYSIKQLYVAKRLIEMPDLTSNIDTSKLDARLTSSTLCTFNELVLHFVRLTSSSTLCTFNELVLHFVCLTSSSTLCTFNELVLHFVRLTS